TSRSISAPSSTCPTTSRPASISALPCSTSSTTRSSSAAVPASASARRNSRNGSASSPASANPSDAGPPHVSQLESIAMINLDTALGALRSGGVFVYPLFVLLLIALMVVLDRFYVYWRFTRLPGELRDLIERPDFVWGDLDHRLQAGR